MAKKKKKEDIEINRIKVVLVEKKMTLKELAKITGKAASSISRICTNRSQPNLKFLRQIALILDVDIKDLLISTKK